MKAYIRDIENGTVILGVSSRDIGGDPFGVTSELESSAISLKGVLTGHTVVFMCMKGHPDYIFHTMYHLTRKMGIPMISKQLIPFPIGM